MNYIPAAPMKKLIKKLTDLMQKLNPQPEVGGLHITDTGLQYARIKDGIVEHLAVRLPEGVMQNGMVQNAAELHEALTRIRLLATRGKNEVPKVVVALPSALVFTQAVRVPYVEEERLEESARLNLQMVSPIEAENSYISWQKIGERENQYELLGAFAEKRPIDTFQKIIKNAGFYPVTFEFPGIALARLFRQTTQTPPALTLVVTVGSDGINLLLLKKGSLYFDYFTSWETIRGSADNTAETVLEGALIKEVKKVMSFASSRLGKSPDTIFFIAPEMEEKVHAILEKNFDVRVQQFTPRGYSVSPYWYVALGAATRSTKTKKGVSRIGFGPEVPSDIFRRERLNNFVRIWRNVIVATASIFIVAHGTAATFLALQVRALEEDARNFPARIDKKGEIPLEEKVQEFNRLVSSIRDITSTATDWHALLKNIYDIANGNGVAIASIETGTNGVVRINATASNNKAIITFKDAIANDAQFKNAELPLSLISPGTTSAVNFTMTFEFK